MQVHQSASVADFSLLGVNEDAGELAAVAHVVGAAAPVEGAFLVTAGASLGGVAGAVVEQPLAAGSCDGVHHARRRDGVHERRLAASWGTGKEDNWNSLELRSLEKGEEEEEEEEEEKV